MAMDRDLNELLEQENGEDVFEAWCEGREQPVPAKKAKPAKRAAEPACDT